LHIVSSSHTIGYAVVYLLTLFTTTNSTTTIYFVQRTVRIFILIYTIQLLAVLTKRNMEPLYHCDICLQLYSEDDLERCCTCYEIFCRKCVYNPHVISEPTDLGEECSFYCSDQCLSEDGRVSLDEVG
jgi:hypothetical protein